MIRAVSARAVRCSLACGSYIRAPLFMSQVLVETLHAVQWLANSTSPGPAGAGGPAVRRVGLAVGVMIFLSCAVLLEWREWMRRKNERERVCCLLVLNLVSSTLSCIRQPRPRLLVLDVCGFV